MKGSGLSKGLWLWVLVFSSGILIAQPVDVGFEGGVPSSWNAAKGKLSISPDHYKEGAHSLLWDWVGGDSIIVTNLQLQGLVPSEVFAYYQNTFRMWVYNPIAMENDSVVIEFYDKQGALQYYYHFYPGFTGWRSVAISYRFEMFGPKASFDLDRMVIRCPESGAGTLFFDYVDYTTDRVIFSANSYHLPYKRSAGGHWSNMMAYEALEKTVPLSEPTSKELEDLEMIRSVYLNYARGTAPSAAVMERAVSRFNSMKISYQSNGSIKGYPLFGGDYSDDINVHIVDEVLLAFARDYRYTLSLGSKRKFMIFVRHLLDQGYARGSVMETVHHIGYDFRNVPLAVFLMKEELEDEGIWIEAREMVEWFIALEGIWDPEAEKSDMDAGNTRAIQRLGACLFQETVAEQVQYVKGFKEYVENWLTLYPRPGEGMKPDYTGFHHNFYYASRYVHPAYTSISFTISILKGSVYEIEKSNQEILKKAIQVGRLSSGGTDLPISLAGRGSMLTHLNSALKAAKNMAEASDPPGTEMAAMYNYYYPGSFEGIVPETVPEGFWQINFSPLGIYRKDDWVVNIKGFNNHFLGAEIYVDAGRYSRYLGYGTVEVLYEGGYEASGRSETGWDWNIIPGTTTIHLPFEKLKAEAARQDETTLSEFAGALRFGSKESYYLENEEQLEGTSGIYGMDFTQKAISSTHDPGFSFKKSMFCFDGKIVCLGSGIANNDQTDPTRTNLFQVNLKSINDGITVNGSDKTGFPWSEQLGAGVNWIIDAYGTGFLVRGDDPVVVKKQTQISPDQSGNGKTSVGNFATAYIDHGVSPNQASYEFIILPNATGESMEELSAEADSFYQVLQKNQLAHIVQHNDWQGHVLFSGNEVLEQGRIFSNSKSCLVISDRSDGSDHLQVAVCDPSMIFEEGGNAIDEWVELTFRGIWALEEKSENVEFLGYRPGLTLLKIKLSQGEPADFRLNPTEIRVEEGSLLNDAFMQGASGYNTSMIRIEPDNREGYLMFDLNNPDDLITGLELRLSPAGSSGFGPIALYQGQHNRWSESNLSSLNRPSETTLLALLDTVYAPGHRYRWILDLDAWNPNDTITLILKQREGAAVNFISKENTVYQNMKPQLIITSQNSKIVSSDRLSLESRSKVRVFPNPFNSRLTIRLDDVVSVKKISISDITGKCIYELIFTDTGQKELTLNFQNEDLPEGLYFLKVHEQKKIHTLKVIKTDYGI